ncbi:MAG TPA: MBL fold metallo-hydrolase [Ignavibacteriaceae bacterium]|nr:MBL fold metallo-hydrolase [Ignavibacteriaceae bacterium]
MSINFRVLGKPGWDNGLMIWINIGTKVYRILFDCGENILKDLNQHDVKTIDYLLFSHLHIDHAAGFDYFFRRNYDRKNKPIYVYGPTGTIDIIHNRLKGFKWNLIEGVPGLWYITDISENKISTSLFKTSDGFSKEYTVEKKKFNGLIIDNPDFSIRVIFLNHIIPSAAYFIKEKPSFNINKEALAKTGLTPGPWLEQVRNLSINSDESIIVNGKSYKLKAFRDKLLVRREGESIGYLTDFIYENETRNKIRKVFKGCDTMVCESQYLSSEKKFASKNYHLIAKQAARLARAANAGKLILFHVSDRYRTREYPLLLDEARELFPNTFFPSEWKLKK